MKLLHLLLLVPLVACGGVRTNAAVPDSSSNTVEVVEVLDDRPKDLPNVVIMDGSLKLPPICPNGVRVFRSYDVGQPYREIAMLDGVPLEASVINRQNKQAAALGANGIILAGQVVAIYIPADMARVRKACAR